MKNNEFVELFAGGFRGIKVNGHCGIVGNKFYNYSTCLCEVVGDTAYINAEKYSHSTGKIQTLLRMNFDKYQEISPPKSWRGGLWNCGQMGAPNLTIDTLIQIDKYTGAYYGK